MGKLVAGLVGAGIGLVKEYQTARQAQSQAQSPQPQQSSRSISQTDAPPPYTVEPDHRTTSPIDSRDNQYYRDEKRSPDHEIENDEEDWDLDDAQGEISPPQESIGQNEDSQATVSLIVQNFLRDHPTPPRGTANGKLPYAVILPQRRPGNKERGFIRAYAPDLLDCGIDQDTFLDFVKAMNKASKASPVFDVIQVSAGIAGFAPSIIAAVVTTAVGAATTAAKSIQLKRQTNSFIDSMNKAFFQPHGLFCLIMTYKPGSETKSKPMDIPSTILKSATQTPSRFGNFSGSAGQTSEIELPAAAPLIFPALDHAAESSNATSGFKLFKKTTSDYMDRRAQAKWSQKNPASGLTVGGGPQFASKHGDPTTPPDSLIGLATGGLVGGRRQARQQARQGGGGLRGRVDRTGSNDKTESQQNQEDQNKKGKKKGGLIRGGIKRMMKEDVLYLMIVNMPSEAEMAAFRNGTSPISSSSNTMQYPQQQASNQEYFPPQSGSFQQDSYQQNGYQQNQSPYQQNSYQQIQNPYQQNQSPYQQNQSPYQQNQSPYQQNQSNPYQQNQPPAYPPIEYQRSGYTTQSQSPSSQGQGYYPQENHETYRNPTYRY